MTQEEKQALVQGMFKGADLSGVRQLIAINEGDVCYQKGTESKADTLDEEQQNIVEELKPIFYGVEGVAAEFLARVQGMRPTEITALVKLFVKERKISELSIGRPLYQVLSKHGIYQRGESNWNQQIR